MTPAMTIYFGYGSNLWHHQMSLRCPGSTFLGVGMLTGWRLQINQRGYCNIVETQITSPSTSPAGEGAVRPADVVFGHVYSLLKEDEEKLDVNEGVPFAYTKEVMMVSFWSSDHHNPVDVTTKPELRPMLVYVDKTRIEDSPPKTEYIYRMNMGILDALKMGIPQEYVDKVVRKFIPPDVTLNDAEREEAEQQSTGFVYGR